MNTQVEPSSELQGVIDSIEDLRAIVGPVMPKILAKEIDHLDQICRDFIALSPFCFVASSNPEGQIDISPKGDPAGFVHVIDSKRLAIPDRPGNRRIDSFQNLIRDPRVGILFLIPGKGETLRVSGTARIVRDERLRQSMAIDGKAPQLCLVVQVERAFMHCPKCMMRSHLWEPATWPISSSLPDIEQAMVRQAKLTETPEELLAEFEQAGLVDLY
jgi:PPOX class probable FMN-dependent enzyme